VAKLARTSPLAARDAHATLRRAVAVPFARCVQLQAPGDVQRQRLLLASGRVSDESPLMAGFPVEFANALDIKSDGTVLFSHSTDVIPYK
jgi:hypothetical protein